MTTIEEINNELDKNECCWVGLTSGRYWHEIHMDRLPGDITMNVSHWWGIGSLRRGEKRSAMSEESISNLIADLMKKGFWIFHNPTDPS